MEIVHFCQGHIAVDVVVVAVVVVRRSLLLLVFELKQKLVGDTQLSHPIINE